ALWSRTETIPLIVGHAVKAVEPGEYRIIFLVGAPGRALALADALQMLLVPGVLSRNGVNIKLGGQDHHIGAVLYRCPGDEAVLSLVQARIDRDHRPVRDHRAFQTCIFRQGKLPAARPPHRALHKKRSRDGTRLHESDHIVEVSRMMEIVIIPRADQAAPRPGDRYVSAVS